jgi:hypothetical protein
LNSPNFCVVANIFLWQSLSTKNQRPQGHNATIDTMEQRFTLFPFPRCWSQCRILLGSYE